MFGSFGYELDLTTLSAEEKEEIREQIKLYKELRQFIHDGEFSRLESPFDGNRTAWQVLSSDKKQIFAAHIFTLAEPNPYLYHLCLRDLDPKAAYKITDDRNHNTEILCGDQLMYSGLKVRDTRHDFQSQWWMIEKI